MNYIVDTSNAISCNDCITLRNYINDFFILVEKFYNANKLSLNSDKSKLLVSCKGRYREAANNLVLVTTDYIIQQSSKIKVLGFIISSFLDNQAYINSIIQKINYRSNILKDF